MCEFSFNPNSEWRWETTMIIFEPVGRVKLWRFIRPYSDHHHTVHTAWCWKRIIFAITWIATPLEQKYGMRVSVDRINSMIADCAGHRCRFLDNRIASNMCSYSNQEMKCAAAEVGVGNENLWAALICVDTDFNLRRSRRNLKQLLFLQPALCVCALRKRHSANLF